MQLSDQKDLKLDNKTTPKEETAPRRKSLPAWTGFSNKTLWDVLQFICTAAIPVVLGIYSMQQSENAKALDQKEQQRNDDNQRAKIASDYLDAMSKYLLEKPDQSGRVNTIARARTLSRLRQLDPERKGQLLKFLYEAGLVTQCQTNSSVGDCEKSKLKLKDAKLDEIAFENPVPMPGIELTGVSLPNAKFPGIDLKGAILQKANLSGAELAGATLKKAQMQKVILENAKVFDAFFNEANLTNALLTNANLSGAHLISANLNGASLNKVILDNADLTNADLRGANLTGASLKGTNLNGAMYSKSSTTFPVNFDPKGKGMTVQE